MLIFIFKRSKTWYQNVLLLSEKVVEDSNITYGAECISDATLLLETFVVLKKLTFGVS